MDNPRNHHNHHNHHRTSQKTPPVQPQTPSSTTHLLWFAATSACIKLLLIPSYHSTDFEVHRNWLAITHTLPLPKWYVDETSPWTLDYPPFFAYFEYFLSLFAAQVDPTIVDLVRGLDYKSPLCVFFQRLSVILSDAVLIYAVHRVSKNVGDVRVRVLILVMVVWSPMLMIVDHVHFQYNGFLLGLLLISLSGLEAGKDVFGGFVFAALICFKHLFAVAAPVYFVYLFRHYCRGGLLKGFARLVVLGSVVVAVFAAAYGPFVYFGQVNFQSFGLV